jgi:site-specific DNA-methyltransferase (adenine-specific)
LDSCPRMRMPSASITPSSKTPAQDWKRDRVHEPALRSRDREWMRKAHCSTLVGAVVVCLVPASHRYAWWHSYAAKGEVRFLKGRLKLTSKKSFSSI